MVQLRTSCSFGSDPGPLLKGQEAQAEAMLRGPKVASRSQPFSAPQLGLAAAASKFWWLKHPAGAGFCAMRSLALTAMLPRTVQGPD